MFQLAQLSQQHITSKWMAPPVEESPLPVAELVHYVHFHCESGSTKTPTHSHLRIHLRIHLLSFSPYRSFSPGVSQVQDPLEGSKEVGEEATAEARSSSSGCRRTWR